MLRLGLLPWSSIITYRAVRFRPATSMRSRTPGRLRFWERERRMRSNRRVVIEYKKPGVLAAKVGYKKASGELKKYLSGEAARY